MKKSTSLRFVLAELTATVKRAWRCKNGVFRGSLDASTRLGPFAPTRISREPIFETVNFVDYLNGRYWPTTRRTEAACKRPVGCADVRTSV